jgi:hypothetical protein
MLLVLRNVEYPLVRLFEVADGRPPAEIEVQVTSVENAEISQ